MRLPLILLAVTGCGEVATSALVGEFDVGDVGTEMLASASFEHDGVHHVPLDDGDRVITTFRGRQFELQLERSGDQGIYTTRFELDMPIAADESVTFSVMRDGGDAPATTVTAPPAWQLDPIPPTIPRSKDFTFSWSVTSDDAMRWQVLGACADGSDGIPPKATSAVIAAGKLVPFTGLDVPCQTSLDLYRSREGLLDPAFAAGRVSFTRTLFTPFTSTP